MPIFLKCWYQEQERQTDLNLNWDSFKYRNYDYAIGRFMSVDPLAEKYPYNGVYNFSENRVLDAREIEGLEAFLVHGTTSDPSTWDKLSDDDVRQLTGNETVMRDFTWPEGTNGKFNNKKDRKKAAEALTNYVINNLKDGEDITLVGHSHGGNVAIQAVNMIRKKLKKMGIEKKIHLITIATPAYNGENDPENPANADVDSHLHFYSENDAVQTFFASIANLRDFDRTYENDKTVNIKVKDYNIERIFDPSNPRYYEITNYKYGPINSHFIHQHPELLLNYKKENDE